MMDRKDIPQRKLAALTGISKTRLGLLLHSDPTKRSPMTVDELQIILHALGTDIVAAYVRIKASGTIPQPPIERHDVLFPMICDAFVDMPEGLIVLLEELEGIDGSEVRPERSEEHTSELQSLMRTSYSVFCLNTKKQH